MNNSIMKYLIKFFNKLTIKQSLMISTIFLAVVPLMFSGVVLINSASTNLLKNQKEVHHTISSLIAGQVNQFLRVVESKVDSVKTTMLFTAIDKPMGESIKLIEKRKTLVSFLENSPEIDYVAVRSDSGENTFSLNTTYDIKNELDKELEPLILSCLHQNRELMTDPILLRSIFKVYIFFVYPVDTPDGRGVIAIAVNMEKIFQSINVRLPIGYEFFITGENGKIIGTSKNTMIGFEFYNRMNEIIGQRKNIVRFNSKDCIVSASNIVGFKAYVVTLIPMDIAYAHIKQMKNKTIGFGILGMLLAIGISLAIGAAIHEPLSVLMTATEQIAKRNFSLRVSLEGNVEVNLLAGRINFMLSEIESYINRLQHLVRYNKKLFFSIISALSTAIDAKDEYTRGHSERVTNISVIIGKYLGLNRVELERLKISGLLHDIGKIGIDDKILRKPGILTEDEFEHMKQHPIIGHKILEPINELNEIYGGVKYHHEKWDGSGYPDKLEKEDIPLFARIIAVADAFDAMTSQRPYQDAMDPDFVVEKIKDFGLTRYDKRVVVAFVKAYKDGKIKTQKDEEK